MELKIQLPRTKSFDIEIDNEHFHSAYVDSSKMVFLTQGEHIVSVSDPKPSMLLWGKITRLINLSSQNSCKYNEEFKFNVVIAINIVISIEYGNYSQVGFVCDKELLSILL
ncbi:MAG: hypothetical protein IJD64_03805 [Clostridia bacterium]|nr:hypothetical protein [Clostridia bacterium]